MSTALFKKEGLHGHYDNIEQKNNKIGQEKQIIT
jgi:hypothetical protein